MAGDLLFPDISRIAALKFPLEMKHIAEAAAARVAEITGRTEGEFELSGDDGTPQARILNRTEEWLADLIIVGSHGQTPFGPGAAPLSTSQTLRAAAGILDGARARGNRRHYRDV